jgi:FtsZ-binding cell division protein ZapB
MQNERNQALDRINLLDMELTAVRGNTAGLQMALQKEQQHGAELEATVAAKDKVHVACAFDMLLAGWRMLLLPATTWAFSGCSACTTTLLF